MPKLIDCLKAIETGTNPEVKARWKVTAREMVDKYEALVDGQLRAGKTEAEAKVSAKQTLLSRFEDEIKEKKRKTIKNVSLVAEYNALMTSGATRKVANRRDDPKKLGKDSGVALARAATALIENDPRYPVQSYVTSREAARGALYSHFGEALESVRKGAFGMQMGKAHLGNIVRELFGEATGDTAAKQFSSAFTKASDLGIDMYNLAGGTAKKSKDYHAPQRQNVAKMLKAGKERWVQVHMETLDWGKMRWPDGNLINPSDRKRALDHTYDILSTNGAIKIDEKEVGGTHGGAIGKSIEEHRFLHYKDADSWLRIQDEFMDGNVMDILTGHIDNLAHLIAGTEVFGPDPKTMNQTIKNIVLKHAAKVGPEAVSSAQATLKNQFDPMFEVAMRDVAMDPNSTMGNLVTGVSNILVSAQLGSAALVAAPGDLAQTFAVRLFNRMSPFSGIGTYIKTLVREKDARQIATQSGFVMDEAVMATYGAQRFSGMNTIGPAASRRISDGVLRASLLIPHTRAARWATRSEFMGLFDRSRHRTFDQLEFKHVLERHGIDALEWDVFRKSVSPWSPKRGVSLLRPIDILKSDLPAKEGLYRKFQGMILDEGRLMVPEATVEGTVRLRNTTRPDTLAGAILHSWSMYKNFPVSLWMSYGRLSATAGNKPSRLRMIAGLGTALVAAGAVGTQLREISKGRDPLAMSTPQFWLKALLTSGALSLWGDFLFQGVNRHGQGPEQLLAGPLGALAADTTQLAFGDVFKFADTLGGLSDKRFELSTGGKAVEYLKRYGPGTNIWWARTALERAIFDRLQVFADPKARRTKRRWETKRRKDYGNESWWEPMENLPHRLPSLVPHRLPSLESNGFKPSFPVGAKKDIWRIEQNHF